MHICCGWARKPIVLSSEQCYYPEQLMARLGSFNPVRKTVSPLVWMPVWIYMEGSYIRLDSKDEIQLACKLVCVYHNNGPDSKLLCDEDSEWHDISEKEVFLAEVGEGEPSSGEGS
jgi:hypothetical protein